MASMVPMPPTATERAVKTDMRSIQPDGRTAPTSSSQIISKKRERLMGGFGSGRPSGSGRGKVEASRSIDVSRLQKAGCLRPGWSGGWQWTRDGETVASINLRTEADCVHLSYTVQVDGGPWENVVEIVRIARVPCRFGGSRPYFICPGVVDSARRRRRAHPPQRRGQ